MSTVSRQTPTRASVHAIGQRRISPPGEDRAPLRAQVSTRQAVGRGAMGLSLPYVVLRLSADAGLSALQALLAVVIWLVIGHRAAQASRAMRFAVGVFAVSAITSLGGIAALSVLGFSDPAARNRPRLAPPDRPDHVRRRRHLGLRGPARSRPSWPSGSRRRPGAGDPHPPVLATKTRPKMSFRSCS